MYALIGGILAGIIFGGIAGYTSGYEHRPSKLIISDLKLTVAELRLNMTDMILRQKCIEDFDTMEDFVIDFAYARGCSEAWGLINYDFDLEEMQQCLNQSNLP